MWGKDIGVPGRYSEAIAVMETMHWSYQEYLDAPEDLVDELLTRLAADAHWRNEKEKHNEGKRRVDAQVAQAKGRHGR